MENQKDYNNNYNKFNENIKNNQQYQISYMQSSPPLRKCIIQSSNDHQNHEKNKMNSKKRKPKEDLHKNMTELNSNSEPKIDLDKFIFKDFGLVNILYNDISKFSKLEDKDYKYGTIEPIVINYEEEKEKNNNSLENNCISNVIYNVKYDNPHKENRINGEKYDGTIVLYVLLEDIMEKVKDLVVLVVEQRYLDILKVNNELSLVEIKEKEKWENRLRYNDGSNENSVNIYELQGEKIPIILKSNNVMKDKDGKFSITQQSFYNKDGDLMIRFYIRLCCIKRSKEKINVCSEICKECGIDIQNYIKNPDKNDKQEKKKQIIICFDNSKNVNEECSKIEELIDTKLAENNHKYNDITENTRNQSINDYKRKRKHSILDIDDDNGNIAIKNLKSMKRKSINEGTDEHLLV